MSETGPQGFKKLPFGVIIPPTVQPDQVNQLLDSSVFFEKEAFDRIACVSRHEFTLRCYGGSGHTPRPKFRSVAQVALNSVQSPSPRSGGYKVTQRLPQKVFDESILRVFISSTFRDMQRERDVFIQQGTVSCKCCYTMALSNQYLHSLRDFAKKKGIELVFIDLRWGLTNRESSSGMVLMRCFESLENCPYFLSVLGSRYGWIPDHHDRRHWHPLTDRRYPFLQKMRGQSITEYEIFYAAFETHPAACRVFFFSRDEDYAVKHVADTEEERLLYQSESAEMKQRQNQLKDRILQRYFLQVFKTPKEFSEMASHAIRVAIEDDFKDSERFDPEEVAHSQFMRQRLLGFGGRKEHLSKLTSMIDANIKSENNPPIALIADYGSGKSSMLSALVQAFLDKTTSGVLVAYHFVGCSNLSCYVENMIQRMWGMLLDLSHQIHVTLVTETNTCGLEALFNEVSSKRKSKLLVVIDAIDQFAQSQFYPQPHQLSWLPKTTSANIAVLVSFVEGHPVRKNAEASGYSIVPLSKLNDKEIEEASQAFLRRFDKRLNENQIQLILSRRADSGHPLYLRIVLEELRVFGVYEKLEDKLNSLLLSKGVVELYYNVIDRWEEQYGKKMVMVSMSALFLSRIGLNEEELDSYIIRRLGTNFLMADWKSFLFNVHDSLFIRNGRYAFFHQLLAESIRRRYLDGSVKYSEMKEYATWLFDRYRNVFPGADVVAEVCFMLLTTKNYGKLVEYLKKEQVILLMLTSKYRFEFFLCWRELGKKGIDHKTTYVEMAKEISDVGRKLVDYFRELHENMYLIPIIETRLSKMKDEELKAPDYLFLGVAYDDQGRYDEALHYYFKYFLIIQSTEGDESKNMAICCNNIATVYYAQGRYEEALEKFKKSHKINLKLFGEEHISTATSYNNIGELYRNQGEIEEALSYFEKSLQIKLKVIGKEHPSTAASFNNIGSIYSALGKFEKALECFEASLQVNLKVLGECHPNTADTFNNMADLYNSQKKFEKSLKYHEKALKIRLKIFGDNHPDTALTYMNMACVYENQGAYEETSKLFKKACKVFQVCLGPRHPHTEYVRQGLARVSHILSRPSHEELEHENEAPETVDEDEHLSHSDADDEIGKDTNHHRSKSSLSQGIQSPSHGSCDESGNNHECKDEIEEDMAPYEDGDVCEDAGEDEHENSSSRSSRSHSRSDGSGDEEKTLGTDEEEIAEEIN